MTAATILTLSNGRGIDLLQPEAGDIDFDVIAEHLAKENRYNGATPDVVYSVAEHSVRGVEAILAETGDRQLAAYFLLHDGHEGFLKDDTTPKKRAIAEIAFERFGVLASVIMESYGLLADRFDAAIYKAAGLAWPPTPSLCAAIKHWDLRMFVTEWRDLMNGQPHPDWGPYAHVEPLAGRIVPCLDWREVREKFADHCWRLLPSLQEGGQ